MEIRIGVQNVNREIVLESNQSSDEIAKAVSDALAGSVLSLSDVKGRKVVVPAASLAYVEIGEEHKRKVGFEA